MILRPRDTFFRMPSQAMFSEKALVWINDSAFSHRACPLRQACFRYVFRYDQSGRLFKPIQGG
jgi:hypothetical protein